jgi:hypothetical protein
MSKPNDKLDFSDITFDDFIGDGLEAANPKEDKAENIENDDDLEDQDDDIDDNNNDDEDDEDNDPAPRKSSTKKGVFDDSDDDDVDDEEDEDDGEGSITDSIAKALGYELEKDYADTEEGLAEFTKDVAKEIAEDQLQALFEQFPTVQKHLDYVLAGGDPDKFFQTYNPSLDYGQIQIDRDDSRTQKGFLTEYLREKGHDDDFIKDMIDDYEDSGKLYDRALNAQKHLAAGQAREKEEIVARQREAQKQQQQQTEEFWESVAATIEQGKEFAGIKIPDREKAKFFDYISKPVDKQGRTKRDVDYASAEMDAKLALDYLMYKKLQLSDIISTKVKSASAQNLRQKIQSNQERVKNFGKAEKGKIKTFDPDQLDVKRLFEK